MKFIKKNWIPIALVLLIIILLGERACRKSTFKEDIKASNDKIAVLETENDAYEADINKAVENAKIYETRVAEIEAELVKSEALIDHLRKKRVIIAKEVMALPPSIVVEQTRQILDCAQVELTEEGVLYSEECAKKSLVMIKEFSLIKEELDETRFSLTKSKEALQLQKQHTWTVYKIAWGLTNQKINYKKIIKEKDYQFSISEKRRKKSWFDGLWKGFVIGVAVTATAKLIFGKLI